MRKYTTTKDAQSVWGDYTNYMMTSTKADLEIEKLILSITSMRLERGYRGTTTQFVLGWLNNINKYEEMTPTTSHFPTAMKKAMLQNAINGIQVFADIKRSEELDIAKGRKAILYDDYTNLVQRVATNHDDKMIVSTWPRYPRIVNEHHIGRDDSDRYYHGDNC